jgi:peptidoglycan/LPS O-acetylase OafA/YrhL
MAFHFGLGVSGGFLGVDLFFVISGFVVTRVLLRERTAVGAIRLRAFWYRRAKRLLPALIVDLAALQLWVRLDSSYTLHMAANSQSLAALTYTSNWFQILKHWTYWSTQQSMTPLNHLWSLAIEEQFYLLWPVLVLVGLRWIPDRLRIKTVATMAVASYLLAFLLYRPSLLDRSYEGTDTRAGALLLGALVALVLAKQVPQRIPAFWSALAAAMVLGLIWVTANLDAALFLWELPVAGVAAAVLVAHLATGQSNPLTRFLGARPVRAIGTISYGLYLWHWPMWVYVNSTPYFTTHLSKIVVTTAASLTAASLSYVLIERPVRQTQVSPRLVIAVLISCMAVIGLSSVVFQPSLPPEQSRSIIVTR